ncbi:MAG: DUF1192 family protein [Pseudomonadota bacterium]
MDDERPKKRDDFTPPSLDPYSLDDLADYRATLEAEIARVDAEAEKKRARFAAAAAVFKN